MARNLYSDVLTIDDFQRAKVADRKRILSMPVSEAQRLASSIPMNTRLRLVSRDLP